MSIFFALAFISMASAQTTTNYFVSGSTGRDTNNGSSWQTPFATVDRAIEVVKTAPANGSTFNIYIAEGEYDVKDKLELRGAYTVNIYGGFPTPNAYTPPTATCGQSVMAYKTTFTSGKAFSLVRLLESGGKISFNDLYLSNFRGGIGDGALLTLDGSSNNKVDINRVVVEGYETGIGGFFYVYGATNVEFNIKDSYFSGKRLSGQTGGSVLSVWTGPPYTVNLDVNITGTTFTGIRLGGNAILTGGSIIGMNIQRDFDKGQSTLTIDKSFFCDTTTTNHSEDGTVPVVATQMDNVTITNTKFYNNIGGRAGAVYLQYPKNFTSTNNIFQGNRGSDVGSILLISNNNAGNGFVKSTNDQFYNNSNYGVYKGGDGNAISVQTTNQTVEITNGTFVGNSNNWGDGGAVHIKGSTSTTISNSTFCNNRTGGNGDGGAIYAGGTGTVTISGSTFNGNQAYVGGNADGGAIAATTPLVFSGAPSHFYNNKAKGDGGAISATNYLTIETTSPVFFDSNISDAGGGAIRANNNLSLLSQVYFQSNSAKDGGAIYVDGTGIKKIEQASFKENSATNDGGAIYSRQGNSSTEYRIENVQFYNNSAGSGGGALFTTVSENAKYEIVGTSFITNKAGKQGGAISIYDGGLGRTEIDLLDSSKFYGNTVAGNANNTTNGDSTSTNPSRSDIYAQYTWGVTYAGINTISNSALQFAASRTNYNAQYYPAFNNNTQQTTALTYAEPSVAFVPAVCPTVPVATCKTLEDTVPPTAEIAIVKTADTDLANYRNICPSKTVEITLSSSTGTAPFTYTYTVKEVDTTGKVVSEKNETQTTTNGSSITFTSATSNTKGNKLIYTITSVTDGKGLTTDLTCGAVVPTVTIEFNAEGCSSTACYNEVTNTTAGTPVNHGITLLQRAGADNGNWPMNRTSAHTVLESNTKGFVITRLSTAELANITNPQEGMMVYDTTEKCLKIYSDNAWKCFKTPACP